MLAETTSEKKPFLPDCLPQNRNRHDSTRPPLPIPRPPLAPSRHAVLSRRPDAAQRFPPCPGTSFRAAPALPSALSRHFLPRCLPRGGRGGESFPPMAHGTAPRHSRPSPFSPSKTAAHAVLFPLCGGVWTAPRHSRPPLSMLRTEGASERLQYLPSLFILCCFKESFSNRRADLPSGRTPFRSGAGGRRGGVLSDIPSGYSISDEQV